MAVARATLTTDVYTAIYNLLQTGTHAITTNNIHPYLDDTQRRKEGYPQVQIMVMVNNHRTARFSGNLSEVNGTIEIQAFHNSAANIKALADEISAKLTTIAARQVLAGDGLFLSDLSVDYGEPVGYMPHRTEHPVTLIVDFRWSSR